MTIGPHDRQDARDDHADFTGDLQAEEGRERLLDGRSGYSLAQVRLQVGSSQTELATAMGVSQNRISVIERGNLDNLEIGTLRRYVDALGGTVRVMAEFGDRSVDFRA